MDESNDTYTSRLRAGLDKNPEQVQTMFDQVASRYDLANQPMTGGQVVRWRRATTVAISALPGERILDLAAGTGTSSAPLARAGARVVACDRSHGMIAEGQRRHPDLAYVEADALNLPFGDGCFDVVTISYGLRNMKRTVAVLQEMRRVTKRGGRIAVCEFSTPTWPPFRVLYRHYLPRAIPLVGRIASSNPSAYHYLAESVATWPDQQALAELLAAAGWTQVEVANLAGGIVALHRAWNSSEN